MSSGVTKISYSNWLYGIKACDVSDRSSVGDQRIHLHARSAAIIFLDLPTELRILIYRFCLVRRKSIKVDARCIGSHYFTSWGSKCDKNKNLLFSKRILAEALRVFHRYNRFSITIPRYGFIETLLPEETLRAINRLEIKAEETN